MTNNSKIDQDIHTWVTTLGLKKCNYSYLKTHIIMRFIP